MSNFNLNADDLMIQAIGSAASRKQNEFKRNHLKNVVSTNQVSNNNNNNNNYSLDPFFHPQSISLNQLLHEESPKKYYVGVSNDKNLNLDEDGDEMTAIQRLIDEQYYDSCNNSGIIDDNINWRNSLPPRPKSKSIENIFKDLSLNKFETINEGMILSQQYTTHSVGVQCDIKILRKTLDCQEKKPQINDPESAVRLLAQRIRELEMDRFGHSPAFRSTLLQDL